MTNPLHALLGMAAWYAILQGAILGWRGFEVMLGKKRANEYPSGTPHGGDRYWRLNRAQINTAENLPAFGAVIIAGTLLGVQAPWFQTLPFVYLAARVAQSTTHIISGGNLAVSVRFT